MGKKKYLKKLGCEINKELLDEYSIIKITVVYREKKKKIKKKLLKEFRSIEIVTVEDNFAQFITAMPPDYDYADYEIIMYDFIDGWENGRCWIEHVA